DLVAGHVDLMFTDASNVLPFVRRHDVKVFGVTSRTRWTAAPDIPTLAEQGLPLYFSLWRGLWAPKSTPADRVAKINAAFRDALSDPAIQKKITEIGQDVAPAGQQRSVGFGEFHRAEAARWWPIMKTIGIKSQ